MKTIIRSATIAAFAAATLLTTACNTIEGVGKDIESSGEAIEEAAK